MSMADKNGAKKNGTVRKPNLIPRIVCFVFAFIMWIYVMVVDSPDYEQRFESALPLLKKTAAFPYSARPI